MNRYPLVAAVSSGFLRSFNAGMLGPFSAWLHFERQWIDEDAGAVAFLIASGCRSILITGAEVEAIHDKVDYIAYDVTKELVLTFVSTKASRNSAFDFVNTRCSNSASTFFLLSVFALDARSEAIALGKNMKLVGLELDEETG